MRLVGTHERHGEADAGSDRACMDARDDGSLLVRHSNSQTLSFPGLSAAHPRELPCSSRRLFALRRACSVPSAVQANPPPVCLGIDGDHGRGGRGLVCGHLRRWSSFRFANLDGESRAQNAAMKLIARRGRIGDFLSTDNARCAPKPRPPLHGTRRYEAGFRARLDSSRRSEHTKAQATLRQGGLQLPSSSLSANRGSSR